MFLFRMIVRKPNLESSCPHEANDRTV